jgi:glucan 1,3-beta-glucosidase
MMGFSRTTVLSILFLGAAYGGRINIPHVEAVVGRAPVAADGYVNLDIGVSEPLGGVAKRTSSYWYENIAHQGISAFGPTGYTVYRNVKDYGAKGMVSHP